jgi:hypothetical protein
LVARSLGRTLEELGETCSAQEFGLWQALYQQSPWGPERIDLAGGVVAATIANVNRGKDQAAFSPLDFMPWSKPRAQLQPAIEPSGADFVAEFGNLPGQHG